MVIKANTWHARVYQWWLRHGKGNTPGYKENLCHYVQVLLFLAPLAWIGEHSPTTWLKRARVGITALCVLAGFGWFGWWIVYLAITNPILLAIIAGSVVGGVVIVALLMILGIVLITDRELEVPGTIKLVGGYIGARKRRICPFIEFEG